jgi:hypothetical protein
VTRWGGLTIAILALGCARPPAPPPADMPRTVAVLMPANQTGYPLLVSGASALERYAFPTDRIGVPDVLAFEARLQLAIRGFTVVAPEVVEAATGNRAPGSPSAAAEIAAHGKLDGLALYLDIRRWDADAPTQPAFVIVDVTASLVEPVTGRVVWSNAIGTRPIRTPGEVTLGGAYGTAARKVAERLLAPLGPERPPAQGG